MTEQKIKIRLQAFDHKLLDQAASEIVSTAKRTGSDVSGPIPMPTNVERYIVNRSPHVNKESREQFEIRKHKRLLIINNPNQQTINSLSKIDLSSGVDVVIKVETVKR